MTKFNLRSIALLVAVTVLASFFGATVRAEDAVLPDSQLTLIKSNCVSTKNTLNQLHASDALLRVNRGQVYESITSKLMQRFTRRVENNNLDASKLNAVLNDYTTALSTFRSDYIAYEEGLSKAIHIDCTNKPSDFYYATMSARSMRLVVHSDVEKLNNLIVNYQNEFMNVKNNILHLTGTVN